ncbi:MAG: hypothetical protein PHH22_01455 [Clostridia bacterium]|nr:hypothetical protein [Clostridia bacterium]
MINKETILKLYNGELYTAEMNFNITSEYKKHSSAVESLYNKLREVLPDDFKYLVEEFRNEIEASNCIIQDSTFCNGFSLGLRITAESLLNNNG